MRFFFKNQNNGSPFEKKNFNDSKIIHVMSVNHANEFFEYIYYPKTFLPECHIAPIVLFLKKKSPI